MGFIKDKSTGLIINTDDGHYKAILAARKQKKTTSQLIDQITDLKEEITEIRNLLKSTIRNTDNQ